MAFEKRIDGETLYRGVIVDVRLDRAELVNGDIVRREVVEHPGGVTIIPVEDDGTVWCVRQFRYPFQREMLEVPAGKLERGEQPLPAAERELGEETGLTSGRMVYLGACCTSPGFSAVLFAANAVTGIMVITIIIVSNPANNRFFIFHPPSYCLRIYALSASRNGQTKREHCAREFSMPAFSLF